LKAAAWDFLKKHPFGFGVSPYATPMPMSMMTMGAAPH
jgi:hypothetical protein